MSAYSIARAQISEAMAAAQAQGVDNETLLRALVTTVVEHYREAEGVESTRSMLSYQLNNCAGDEDFEFMRP